jgi:hypothetical protein
VPYQKKFFEKNKKFFCKSLNEDVVSFIITTGGVSNEKNYSGGMWIGNGNGESCLGGGGLV